MTDLPSSSSSSRSHQGSPAMTSEPHMAATLVLTPSPAPSLFPWEDEHMQVHTVLIVIIFCVVCFLLLVAFFYAFCFRCSLEALPKDPRQRAHSGSMEREDATYRRSSSDGPSVANTV